MNKKYYIWTATVFPVEENKFDVIIGEEASITSDEYKKLTAEEIGNILAKDINAVNKVWNEEEEKK